MSKGQTKLKSKLKYIFDKGDKLVSKGFVAFFIYESTFSSTIIASKKVGNAVKRNRCKRRLRELLRKFLIPKFDNVAIILLAREATPSLAWEILENDMARLEKRISSKINQTPEN